MLRLLLIILLLEGFVTISIEILTIRQLLPFFGGSVIITSIIIGVFLLFLALGYWRGGMYHGGVLKKLSTNFSYAFLWMGFGLSYTIVGLYYGIFITQLGMPVLWGLTGFLLLILAPIIYWLGQTLPLTTHLFNQELHVSHISGKALFLSTIGSFLGAILTSLILFQYVGVAWTLVINCIILFALVVYMRPLTQESWWIITFLSVGLLFIKIINTDIESQLFVKTNNYANYRIIESTSQNEKILSINNSASSLITPDKKGFPYIQWLRELLFDHMNMHHQKILVIGAGGFTLTADSTHDNDVHYVDIDSAIKNIAESYFLKKTIQGTFEGQDARAYLNQTNTKFNVIVSDAYSNQSTIPTSLLTHEYFQDLSDHLLPSGFMIVNIIANPYFTDNYAKSISNTIHSVFPHCIIIPMDWENALTNVLYVCPKVSPYQALYSDNLNSVTLDFFNKS